MLQGDVDDGGGRRSVGQLLCEPAIPRVGRQGNDRQIKIGAVETCDHDPLRRDAEFGLHILNNRRCGGGGEQQHLRDLQVMAIARQLEVVGAKVVAPLRDTVRLIDDQQRERHLLDKTAKTLVLESLHRDHQDLELVIQRLLHHSSALLRALARVEGSGAYSLAFKEGELIVHQRQQRRYNQGQVRQGEGRQLITERLA